MVFVVELSVAQVWFHHSHRTEPRQREIQPTWEVTIIAALRMVEKIRSCPMTTSTAIKLHAGVALARRCQLEVASCFCAFLRNTSVRTQTSASQPQPARP